MVPHIQSFVCFVRVSYLSVVCHGPGPKGGLRQVSWRFRRGYGLHHSCGGNHLQGYVLVLGWGDGAVQESGHFVSCTGGSGGDDSQGHWALGLHYAHGGLDHGFEPSGVGRVEDRGDSGGGKGDDGSSWHWESHTEAREGFSCWETGRW